MERFTEYHGSVPVLKDKKMFPEAVAKLAELEDLEEHRVGKWIPCSERIPEDDKYIMLSFENFSLPAIGRYEANENGGAFFVSDEDLSCVAYGLFVNAWMPLIEPYRENEDD